MIIPAPAPVLTVWFAPFASAFTAPTLRGVLVLIAGAILAPGRRTVTSALSILGLREIATFTTFHRVLNRNRWSPRDLARRLLHQLAETFGMHPPKTAEFRLRRGKVAAWRSTTTRSMRRFSLYCG